MSSNKPISIHLKSVKQFLGDTKQNISTISGNLEHIHRTLTKRESVSIKRNIFGRTWVYKLNKNEEVINKKSACATNKLRNVILGCILFILVTSGILIAFGPQLFELQGVKNDTYLFKTIPSLKQNTTPIIKIEKNIKSIEKLNNTITKKKENSTVSTCFNCTMNETCLQVTSDLFPKCVQSNDASDPTGCGGLCILETQFCKKLDRNLHIYTCIDIETFHCDENQFKCDNNLMCIAADFKCNGIINCIDYSDELNCECDLHNNFRCGGNISCMPNTKRCDGSVDCWDAIDETSCIQECELNEVPCYNGECIDKELFCNGSYDCNDKSDEPSGCAADIRNETFVQQ